MRTPTTDTGNAEYLASLFGDQVRYDHRRQRWLLWKSHRWEPDGDGYIARLAINAARNRYNQASQIEDLKERQQVANWAISSESRQKIDACLALAKNLKPIADNGENWDSDIWKLGIKNGVVDLGSGDLCPGRREDRITMAVGAEFDPGAKCPRWEQFLTEVFGDEAFIDWLQRALGYSISGDTTEQVVFMGHGSGANGKGVFSNTIQRTLRDYAYSAPFSTFELHQRANIPNDLAALEFKRFVCSSETNDDTRLNEARIKALTGGDPITARYLHQEYFTFYPHLKLWLFVNHRPKVLDDSFGFWRRVRLIPFTRQFTGTSDDRQLGEKLRAEEPGILAWLVRGCLEWQRRGLDPAPECVRAATQEYRQESDPLAGFVAEKCIEEPSARVQASEIYKAYKQWAETEGMGVREILTSTMFGKRMGEKFRRNTGRLRHYLGIGLASQEEVRGSSDSSEHKITECNVSSIVDPLREKTINNPRNYRNEHEIDPKPTQPAPKPSPSGDNHHGHFRDTLGMPADAAVQVWHFAGSPIIHLGPGENCLDLEGFLASPRVRPDHLEAVRVWLEGHVNGRG